MKTLNLIMLVTLLSLTARAQSDSEKKLIQGSITRFFDAISALDDNALKAEVTGDFTLIEHGLVWTADSLINHLKPMKETKFTRVNMLNFIKTEQRGNVAWLYYFNTAEISRGTEMRVIKWLESAVLTKQSGKWKIKLLHSTDLE
jgi:ketosteroid isomerase-like protein